jgi:PPOX class probable FMN-dependent enzyme
MGPQSEPDMSEFNDHIVTSIEQLAGVYGEPYGPSVAKVADHVTPQYRAFIEAAPFFALASCGAGGLDCSPRGDAPGFVRVHDAKTLLIPDRLGNNRIDSIRNILEDPRVALLFLIPGCGETIRVMGRAKISTDPALAGTFVVNGKTPRAVFIVAVEQVYFQCTKAIIRSKLWDASQHVDRKTLPTPGMILAERTGGKTDAVAHDRAAPERIKATLY